MSRRAYRGPMSETGFSARQAADVLTEASRYEDALRQRTEGITWMVWGIVSPAIWLSYGLVGASFEDFPVWARFLWAPWVFVGVVTTIVIWRSAALAAPRIVERERPGWLIGLAWAGVTALLFFLLERGVPGLNGAVLPLFVISSAWVLFGLVDLNRASPTGRRVSVVIGALTLTAAFALAFAASGHSTKDYILATWGSVLATSVFPLAGGFWQAMRN